MGGGCMLKQMKVFMKMVKIWDKYLEFYSS